MSATEELRRLLDERGVEHYDGTETTLWGYESTSESTGVYRIAADEISGGRMQLRMFNVTPAQAVDATRQCLPKMTNQTKTKGNEMAHLTDELRNLNDINGSIHVFRDDLDKIADRIDKRHHEECLRYWSDGCACGPDIPNSVRLPLDANGIPINVGDWTEYGRVGVLALGDYGQWTVFTLEDDSDHKPSDINVIDPTPKQVLLDFAERMQYGIGFDKDDLVNDTLRRLGFEE